MVKEPVTVGSRWDLNPDLVSLVSMSSTESIFGFPATVNEVSARLVAAGTALLGLACLAVGQPWIAALLALEFLARVLSGPRFEPMALLVTRVITPRLPLAERPTPGPPKRFAQAIGLVVTLAALVAVPGRHPRRRVRTHRHAGGVRHTRVHDRAVRGLPDLRPPDAGRVGPRVGLRGVQRPVAAGPPPRRGVTGLAERVAVPS